MKIIIIKNFYKPYQIGGAEILVENMVDQLTDKFDLNVVIVTLWDKKKIEIENVKKNYKIYRLPISNVYFPFPNRKKSKFKKIVWWILNLWNPVLYFRVKKIIMEEKPNLVHLHNFYGFSNSVISSAISCKVPIHMILHDFYISCFKSSFQKENGKICQKQCLLCKAFTVWNKQFTKRITKAIFLSHFSENLLKKQHGIDGIVVHNPCFLPKDKIQENRMLKHATTNVAKKIVELLYMGRLDKHKGVKTLLAAIQSCKREDIRITLAGDGELRNDVEIIVKQDKRVRYVGFVVGEEKEALLLKSNFFMLTSEWYEVSPLVIQECFSFGVPVIGSDIGSIPEHIENKSTGLLYKCGDVEELSNILNTITVEISNKMSTNCFDEALENNFNNYITKILSK